MYKGTVRKNARNVLIFSKWRRTNYAAFQTLKREVVISVLVVSYLLSVPLSSVSSVPDTTEIKQQYDLDEIEVSAQRAPVLYSQVARVVSVITREEIEYAPVSSIQDLLEYIAGVDVRQRGAEGVQADVSIRGGTFDQTLILLNGVNITDPQTGHHNLNLPVSFNQIERIEILEGPAARVYGPNAFSGAINIITRQPEDSSFELAVEGGSFDYLNLNAMAAYGGSKMQHIISAGRKTSNGYINNTDFEISDIFYSGKLNLNKGTLNFQLGNGFKGFGANSFYTPKYPNQYEETKTWFSSVKWQSKGKWHFTPVVYYRKHKDRFELYREDKYHLTDGGSYVWNNDTVPGWYVGHNYHLTNTFGVNINSWIQWSAGKSAFGIELRSENILSNVLGEELSEPKSVPGEDAQFTKSYSRNNLSLFLEHTFLLNDFSATAGVLGNYIFDSGIGLTVFPGIDLSYQVTDGVKVYTSFNTSLRMPTFTDLFYKGVTNIGNPDLKPEKSATIEGGLKWSNPFIQGSAVVFYRDGNNIIDWVKLNQEDLWQPQNLTSLFSYGTEIQAMFNLKKWLGNGFPDRMNLNYFFNDLEKKETSYISNYTLDNIKHKITGSLNYNVLKNFVIDLKVIYQDRDGTFTAFNNGSNSWEEVYPSFWIFDGKLSYTTKAFQFYCSANNIFNQHYFDLGNLPQPGRLIKAGITYRFSNSKKE
ncbi:MAG: TonB-dependent receptor [Prolixibacteraceae bacterium]|nr:TonB-dependent receptor [Prolixibacteraceae bacterium]